MSAAGITASGRVLWTGSDLVTVAVLGRSGNDPETLVIIGRALALSCVGEQGARRAFH
jgi:hypothetical protein